MTFGFEGLLYAMLTLTMFIVVLFWLPISVTWSFAAALCSSLVLPFALSVWLRGPVFRFMDIDILTQQGRQASRITCATRNTIAWFPLILSCGCFVAISGALIAEIRPIEPAEGTFTYELLANRLTLYSFGSVLLVAVASSIAGAIYSVLKPCRGIQDWITQTVLMPR